MADRIGGKARTLARLRRGRGRGGRDLLNPGGTLAIASEAQNHVYRSKTGEGGSGHDQKASGKAGAAVFHAHGLMLSLA
ncbi:MAG: hypothetical protein Kow0032_22270 [Methyloligellaceae bacterium]